MAALPAQSEKRIFRLEVKTGGAAAKEKVTKLTVLCERYVGAQLFKILQSAGPECWREERWQRAKSHLHSQVSEDVLRSLNAYVLEAAAAGTTYERSKVAKKWRRKAFQLWWLFLKAEDKRTLLPLWPYSYQTPYPFHHPFPYWPKSSFSEDLALFLASEATEAKGVQLESLTIRINTSAHHLSRALKSQTNLKHLRVLVPTARRGSDAVTTLASSFSSPVLQSLTVCHGYACGQKFYRHGNAPHLGQFILPCVQAHSTTLTSLELPTLGSSLCNVHAVEFEKALNLCTQLQTLSTSGECMSHFSPLLRLPSVRHLHLIWSDGRYSVDHSHDYARDFGNILRVCPGVTELTLKGVFISDITQLERLKDCLKEITCIYKGMSLLDLLTCCCPNARKIQIVGCHDANPSVILVEEPCISMPFLQEFELNHKIHHMELKCLLKGSPDLRKLSLRVGEIDQADLIALLLGGGVLRKLETFHLKVVQGYNQMTMVPLLLELMRLPSITTVDNALWCRLNNEEDWKRVFALAMEKGMDVVEAYLCREKRCWLAEDGTRLSGYSD